MKYAHVLCITLCTFCPYLISMENKNKKQSLSFDQTQTIILPTKSDKQNNASDKGGITIQADDLATLAPVAIVMYCFKEHPKFTMVSLAGMLLAILFKKEVTRQKIARMHRIIDRKWFRFKNVMIYLWARTQL